MTFKDIKIGTILYEVVTEKSHFDIVERTVDSMSHSEKKVTFSLCPKEGFKDWVYHAHNNGVKIISRQHHPIFTSRYCALDWLKQRLKDELSYLEKQMSYVKSKGRDVDAMLFTELKASGVAFHCFYPSLNNGRMSYGDYVSLSGVLSQNNIVAW